MSIAEWEKKKSAASFWKKRYGMRFVFLLESRAQQKWKCNRTFFFLLLSLNSKHHHHHHHQVVKATCGRSWKAQVHHNNNKFALLIYMFWILFLSRPSHLNRQGRSFKQVLLNEPVFFHLELIFIPLKRITLPLHNTFTYIERDEQL